MDGVSVLGGGVELVLDGLPWTDTSLIVADTLVGSCNGMSKAQQSICYSKE